MTQEEILEGNKLIAEFMGGTYKKSAITLEYDYDRIYLGEDEVMYQINPRYESYALKYHSSWDWLMPVVEKIEAIKGIRLLMKPFACEILIFGKSLINEAGNTKIESVWLAVIEFIKWYNQNK